jgi:hippurate hydrolase
MNTLREEIATVLPEMIGLRHHIHQHPELAFEEHATSDLVAQRLAEWGYEVHRGLGGTGVVGRLRHGSGSRSIGIRADMDALPIT